MADIKEVIVDTNDAIPQSVYVVKDDKIILLPKRQDLGEVPVEWLIEVDTMDYIFSLILEYELNDSLQTKSYEFSVTCSGESIDKPLGPGFTTNVYYGTNTQNRVLVGTTYGNYMPTPCNFYFSINYNGDVIVSNSEKTKNVSTGDGFYNPLVYQSGHISLSTDEPNHTSITNKQYVSKLNV